ncbi:MAG: cytochrome P450 [Bacteroidetes bacterium]|nr:cytochrome P450 [Bacteroidota bacterium]
MRHKVIGGNTYHLPSGYSFAQVFMRSLTINQGPIETTSENMEKFDGTYSMTFPGNQQLIVTQDAGFINHVLREKHTNYKKSAMTSGKAARLFGDGLLFSNGDFWLQQRRLIQPGFHSKKLQGLYEIVARTIDETLAAFPTGENVDFYPLMHRLSFDIVIRALFDIDLSPATMQELTSLFTGLQNFLIRDIRRPFRKFLYPINGQERLNLKRSDQLKDLIRQVIRQRRNDPKPYNDLLDMLLSTRYEDSGEPMSEEQLIAEVLILLFAGHETTANTLSWLLYLVSSKKDILDRLTELSLKLDINESIRNEYFQAVINESMRLRPAAWMADREAIADDSFAGYSYPAGTVIMTFFYGLHRHREFWENSDVFDPNRFIDENGKIRKSPAFFPFGAGPRMCIGNNFAMAEMGLFLRAFFSKFEISPTSTPPELMPLITLRPDKVLLNVKKR